MTNTKPNAESLNALVNLICKEHGLSTGDSKPFWDEEGETSGVMYAQKPTWGRKDPCVLFRPEAALVDTGPHLYLDPSDARRLMQRLDVCVGIAEDYNLRLAQLRGGA